MQINEAIERVLIESGLSISAFSRKIGYSRQYVYQLLKKDQEGDHSRKIQLDTLKRICDGTDYSLQRLLAEMEYLPPLSPDPESSAIIVVGKRGERTRYELSEQNAKLIESLTKTLAQKREG